MLVLWEPSRHRSLRLRLSLSLAPQRRITLAHTRMWSTAGKRIHQNRHTFKQCSLCIWKMHWRAVLTLFMWLVDWFVITPLNHKLGVSFKKAERVVWFQCFQGTQLAVEKPSVAILAALWGHLPSLELERSSLILDNWHYSQTTREADGDVSSFAGTVSASKPKVWDAVT